MNDREVYLVSADDEIYLGTVGEILHGGTMGDSGVGISVDAAISDIVSELAFNQNYSPCQVFVIELRVPGTS